MRRIRKATIYDIAVAANASPTTVSLVLNDSWQRYRIKKDTATKILGIAERLGYAVNLKARGLRLSRSGLAGMIVPHYRNRFFAGLAEAFEGNARSRGLCPIVVSTHRNPGNEVKVDETLLAQQVEFLFIAGVHHPDPLNELCHSANVRCVNVDLPGPLAPSVVSDNRGGARQLTNVMLEKLKARDADPTDLFFFGGVADDDATRNRVLGFNEALAAHGIAPDRAGDRLLRLSPNQRRAVSGCRLCPARAVALGPVRQRRDCARGRAPLHRHAGAGELQSVVVGSFDWDPFAAHLPFDVTMVRQNVEAMIAEGFSAAGRLTKRTAMR